MSGCFKKKKKKCCFTRREAFCQTRTSKHTYRAYRLHVEQTVHLLRTLHLNKYFIAPRGAVRAAVCSAYMQAISLTPDLLLRCNAWWISRCPNWAAMIKRKSWKVKSAGFLLQRRNLLVMALCTSLCSAALSQATVQHTEGQGPIDCNLSPEFRFSIYVLYL